MLYWSMGIDQVAFLERAPAILDEVEVLCSGVILDEDMVLTTATCCDGELHLSVLKLQTILMPGSPNLSSHGEHL